MFLSHPTPLSQATTPNTAQQPIGKVWFWVICAAWIIPGLLAHDPWKPDEAYTFGLIYSLLHGSSWVIPTLAHEPFMEKPPLFYLSAALVSKLFSPVLPLHDAARLATGLYMASTFAFVAATARELYGKSHSWIAVMVLIGCCGLLVRGHQMISDISLLTGFAAALYGLAVALRRPVLGGFWLGTGVGIGFMSKGLLEPGILGIVSLALLLFPAWRNRNYMRTLLVAASAAAPWFIIWPLALYHNSPALFNEWLWVNNFGRFFGSNHLGPPAQPAQYLRILPWYALPAWPLAGWVLWRTPVKNWSSPTIALPLTAFFVTFAVLSFAATARELYAMPMLLPITLLATTATDTLRRGAANLIYWFSVMGGGFFIIVAWFYWTALDLNYPAGLHAHLMEMQPGYSASSKWIPLVLGTLFSVSWIAFLLQLKKTRERPIIAWAASLTMMWGLLAILFIGWVDTGKSYRSVSAAIQKALPANVTCIASRNLGEPQRAMLDYFEEIITIREEVVGRKFNCNVFLIQGFADRDPDPGPGWRKIWQGARPGDNSELFRLYRRVGR